MSSSSQIESTTYTDGYWEKRFILYDVSKPTLLQAESLEISRSKAAGRGIKMLELGCGDGRSLFAYSTTGMLHPDDIIIAHDLSSQALNLTVGATPQAFPVRGDAMQLPYGQDSFDFVFCSMLIEHLPDSRLLDNILYILKPGGTLYLSTMIRRPYAPFRKRSPEGRLVLAANHLREYRDEKEITDLVGDRSYSVVQTSSWLLRESIVRRVIMLCLKLGLFRISLERRMMQLSPMMKKTMKIWALVVPIPGYYVFEGIFTADKS